MNDDERRRSYRGEVAGSAVIADNRDTSTYGVANLSERGALIIGGPAREPGARISMKLDLPGCEAAWVDAHVVRTTPAASRTSAVAVQFDRLRDHANESLHHALSCSRERAARPTVLIVDSIPSLRRPLTTTLWELGRRSVVATTAQEVVGHLTKLGDSVDTALVELMLDRDDGLGVLEMLERDYPDIRRVLMCNWAWSAELDLKTRARRAHALLFRPCSPDHVRDALPKS